MFNFEKLVNSPFFRYADLLYKIIFINVMVVILSLPIITFFPALVAGYEQIKFYSEENEAPLFKSFIQAFKKNFMRHVKVGIILIIVMLLIALNIRSYQAQIEDGLIFVVGLYVSLVLLFFLVLMVVHLPLSCIYFPKLNTKDILKIAFYIGIKHVFTSILLLLPLAITFLLISYAFPIYTFVGIGIPIYISLKFTTRIYKQLERE